MAWLARLTWLTWLTQALTAGVSQLALPRSTQVGVAAAALAGDDRAAAAAQQQAGSGGGNSDWVAKQWEWQRERMRQQRG